MTSSPKRKPVADHSKAQLHKYITRNSEYLVRGGVCISVRARHTSDPRQGHLAVEQPIVARVRWRRDGGHDVLTDGAPEVGDSLVLGVAERALLTSAVWRIEAAPVDETAGKRKLPL